MLGPMDEFPVHQVPQPIAWPGSRDRNFYDRSYFNAHDRTGDIFVISGIGYYPNLGVKDAFVLVRRGRRADRGAPVRRDRSGPAEPARRRLPGRGHRAAAQAAHRARRNRGHRRRPDLGRVCSTSCRSSRTSCGAATASRSTPSGSPKWAPGAAHLSIDGEEIAVDPPAGSAPATARGASARSASPSRPGRPADPPFEGMWWLYVPMAFDDFGDRADHPGGARRLPLTQRLHADLARRPRRATGLAAGEDPLPIRHPHPDRRDHRRDRRSTARPVRFDVESKLPVPDPRRRRLRRRLRLAARHVEGREVHRTADLRHDRSRRSSGARASA